MDSSNPNFTDLRDSLLKTINKTRTDFRRLPFDSSDIGIRMEDLNVDLIKWVLFHAQSSAPVILQRIIDEECVPRQYESNIIQKLE